MQCFILQAPADIDLLLLLLVASDTYGEYYEELHQFHLLLPKLLKPAGVYSYFNGLASDNFFFHMVYGR